MVNFMCCLDWVTGHPDVWPDVIPGVSVRVFWDEINTGICKMSKADCLPSCE